MADGSTPRKNPGTETSAFGSAGRENHDASEFYDSRMYAGLPKGRRVKYVENLLPPEKRNCIFAHSSEVMDELPDDSVHLMVTSPPYNASKEYDQDLSLTDYLNLLQRVWQQVYRVLVPGGRACINIANLGRKPYIPLHAHIIAGMQALGFLMRGEIIWNKSASAGSSTAWGSWQSAANPTLRDVHEYILVFCKDTFRRANPDKRADTITRDEFLEFTKSVWTFGTVSARKIGHPAPFPAELPYRLTQLYTFAGEVVLDPFMGSGQTAIGALQAGRDYIGYETNAEYVSLAQARIRQSQVEADSTP
jgi:site-specific DNA-methyltransferase (adenine-specific)